ncbi:NAD(P)-dependent dehydrogenase (short-subunit alcohol dehydrogenase family) [Polymorphobacter multimanifer]|uniref:NAD(P)-dependent dehydrogenase (Short-subunit alcohol dehydrogenase family) n=1 Tax=Polymorphobacter multimanifer TaxID=1070431 RepID=A0A841LGF6_9SPHN|nr:SDR family NAD(P)-dependent oxidoreductase [Polymorphobacter multimanifer]MBB6228272.1 NAD(P)-dependent dehydrogenase (short-subunit alcohol dehydrogenase family) [Polymorphobacter multimanifer]
MLAAADRVVMISGTGRGIGRAIAERLEAEGFRLSLGNRRPGSGFPGAFHHRFDAEVAETASAWVAATVAAFGRIDALINNAGTLTPFTLATGSEAELDRHWAVNVKAPLRLIRAAMPYLEASGRGRIVTIASTDGKRVRPGSALAYAMTKHAVVALTHAARLEGWDKGVRATALCPGAVDTDLIADLPGVTPKADRMQPATVAEAVAFLLSLPNTASVAELVMNTRMEPSL